jgi:hypothetical protein
MHRLHSWHIFVAIWLTLIAWHFSLFAASDDVYGTLFLGIGFITLVHTYFTVRNGERHDSLVVVRNVCSRFTGK